jgi:hypothetical protein
MMNHRCFCLSVTKICLCVKQPKLGRQADPFSLVFTIDLKVLRINGYYGVPGILFTDPDHAKIGQIRLPISIPVRQIEKVWKLFIQVKSGNYQSVSDHRHDCRENPFPCKIGFTTESRRARRGCVRKGVGR